MTQSLVLIRLGKGKIARGYPPRPANAAAGREPLRQPHATGRPLRRASSRRTRQRGTRRPTLFRPRKGSSKAETFPLVPVPTPSPLRDPRPTSLERELRGLFFLGGAKGGLRRERERTVWRHLHTTCEFRSKNLSYFSPPLVSLSRRSLVVVFLPPLACTWSIGRFLSSARAPPCPADQRRVVCFGPLAAECAGVAACGNIPLQRYAAARGRRGASDPSHEGQFWRGRFFPSWECATDKKDGEGARVAALDSTRKAGRTPCGAGNSRWGFVLA